MQKTTWNRDNIRTLLLTRNEAVEHAITALYARQTEDEKADKTTKHDNGRGFSAGDASLGSYMARWVLKGRRLTGRFLVDARKMSLRYTRQLAEIANAKEALKH